MRFAVVLALLLQTAYAATKEGYVGGQVCAGCHKTIAASQVHTAMAQTWQGKSPKEFPANDSEAHAEGPAPDIDYLVKRSQQGFTYHLQMPGHPALAMPVETTMGGTRHGLSFLVRVPEIDGSKLAHPPLVEARYLHYVPHDRLELSPGFPEQKPSNYETAVGRVLEPRFGAKCLSCHGEPRTVGTHIETGVTCESCHGPGHAHLLAVAKGASDKAILNPRKLPVADQMHTCAQCHSGFALVQDPMPDDLLISDQVTALQNAECWRQSGGKVTCTNCHNPHEDAPRATLVQRSEKTCLGCHSAQATRHAALCPVNRRDGCVGCHMPDEKKSVLKIADHWIRVHPEQSVPATENRAEWRSTVPSKRVWLRMIVTADRSAAEQLRQQIVSGGSFFELARVHSIDPKTAANGGFAGDLTVAGLNSPLRAAASLLRPAALSNVIEDQGKFFLLQRMARNFREDAETVFNKAMDLRAQGQRQQSAAELLEALKIYPHLLRALTYLGITYGEAGNPTTGAAILTLATRLYPQDAGAHYNLGIALGALGKEEEIAEYRRALDIDSDQVLVYLNLGAALYAKGQYDEAVKVYRDGIRVNPLIASLHYSLGVALGQQGKSVEAQQEIALASKIDPNVGKPPASR
jgi:predicted CXXCH cytochrome family protein